MGRSLFPCVEKDWLLLKIVDFHNVEDNKMPWLQKVADEFLEHFNYPKPGDPISIEEYRTEVSDFGISML